MVAYFRSPVGTLEIELKDEKITGIKFLDIEVEPVPLNHAVLEQCFEQLNQYFYDQRETFDIPINPLGTPFQQKVWSELLHIPFGRTSTYLEIAKKLGDKKKIRAVGMANGKNPIPIIIPCHRVIGTNRNLVGFAGGLWRKEWLLKHENILMI